MGTQESELFDKKMKIIGLTGGIGSGKSTFLKWFESKGIPCFDSDKVGRVLLEKELKEKIIDRFGPSLYSRVLLIDLS